jgi:hypothetical protein
MRQKDEIRNIFPYLFEEFGFVFEDEPKSDLVVVAQSGDLRLRFIKDRADFFLDVGRLSMPDQWIGFYQILDELKRNNQISYGYKYANKMKPVSGLLQVSFPLVREYILAKS